MNKQLIGLRFGRAATSYEKAAVVQAQVAHKLMSLLPKRTFNSILEIGCGSGFLTKELVDKFPNAKGIANDLSPAWEPEVRKILTDKWMFKAGDAEELVFKDRYDLIASSSSLQWFIQPDIFLKRMYDILLPNGYLLISTFGSRNFEEIKLLTGMGLHYPSIEELFAYLPSSANIHFSEELIKMTFDSPMEILKHLKDTGVNATNKRIWTRKTLADFYREYESRFLCCLTYNPVYILIYKP